MPKYIANENQYEVQDNLKLMPTKRSRGLKKRIVKSPLRGGIRLCRVVEEKRIKVTNDLSRE
jgi:hypothetical protein